MAATKVVNGSPSSIVDTMIARQSSCLRLPENVDEHCVPHSEGKGSIQRKETQDHAI